MQAREHIPVNVSMGIITKYGGKEMIQHSFDYDRGVLTAIQGHKDNQYLAEQLTDSHIKEILQKINTYAPNVCLHCIYTAIYASAMASKLGYDRFTIAEITKGCLVHDLGKISIPPVILNKPNVLTDNELSTIKLHPEYGYLQTRDIFSKTVNDIVLMHHEKLDGSGYPKGLKEDQIPEYVQIVTIADEYEALTGERCYKKVYTHYEAIEELIEESKYGKINKKFIDLIDKDWIK